jgi:Tol biopolymer transport system component
MPGEKKRASAEVKQPPPPKIKLAVQEVDLGPSPKVWVWREGWITPSEDCKHVAYRAREGGKWRIFRDGVPGKECDEARNQWFSPDGKHLAYLARITNTWRIVLDGVDGPAFSRYDETTKHYWPFVFSPDSARLAYVATNDKDKQYVVVDGVEGPVFDQILHHSFSFSENSKHFIYAARRGREGVVIKDGQEIVNAEDVLSPVQTFGATVVGDTFGPFLSPDGSRFACVFQRSGKWIAVIDGKESPPWDSISDLSLLGPSAGFSPDGRHFTYVGEVGKNQFVVIDQKINTNGWAYSAVFSPDSSHSAFVRNMQKSEREFATCAVLDGVAGKPFQGEVKDLTFSPDGRKLAYKVGESGAHEYVVVHGGETFDDYAADGDIVFSPDSRHMAFHGRKNAQSYFLVDGEAYLKCDDPYGGTLSSYFTFSPDSKRWGFIAQHKDKKYAVISGVEYGPYYHLGVPNEDEYIYFSPDSRHFAFIATRQNSPQDYVGKEYLVVDGLEHEIEGRWLSGSFLRFDSATKLHGLVIGKERMTRLEAEILKN